MKKNLIAIIIFFILFTTGCKNNNISKSDIQDNEISNLHNEFKTILKDNNYNIRTYTNMEAYDKNEITFVFYNDTDEITIAYEEIDINDNIIMTATTNYKNLNVLEMESCNVNLSTNNYSKDCNNKEIEFLKKAKEKIEIEMQSIGLEF